MAKAKKKKAKAKPKKAARRLVKRAGKKAAKKAARKKTAKKAAPKPARKAAKKAAAKPARKAAKKAVKKAAPKAAPAPPAQPVMVHGVICHVEIPSDDVGSAKQFYAEVFGWTFEEMPMGEGKTYTVYQTRQGGIGGGIMTPPPGAPKQTVNYILVNDIAPVLEQVRRAGGDVVTPTMEVPGAGWMAHFTDPDGNLFGLWKPNMGGQG
jgi:predicted enzyme related to lactoylglutathione lyase